MTKKGYTHIIVTRELHALLKKEAEAQGISIANYIAELQSNLHSIRSLVADSSNINTMGNALKTEQSGLNDEKYCSAGDCRTDLLVKSIKIRILKGYF